jgi:hypothetical protein
MENRYNICMRHSQGKKVSAKRSRERKVHIRLPTPNICTDTGNAYHAPLFLLRVFPEQNAGWTKEGVFRRRDKSLFRARIRIVHLKKD